MISFLVLTVFVTVILTTCLFWFIGKKSEEKRRIEVERMITEHNRYFQDNISQFVTDTPTQSYVVSFNDVPVRIDDRYYKVVDVTFSRFYDVTDSPIETIICGNVDVTEVPVYTPGFYGPVLVDTDPDKISVWSTTSFPYSSPLRLLSRDNLAHVTILKKLSIKQPISAELQQFVVTDEYGDQRSLFFLLGLPLSE